MMMRIIVETITQFVRQRRNFFHLVLIVRIVVTLISTFRQSVPVWIMHQRVVAIAPGKRLQAITGKNTL